MTSDTQDIEKAIKDTLKSAHNAEAWEKIKAIDKKVKRLRWMALIPLPAIPTVVLVIMGVPSCGFTSVMVMLLALIQAGAGLRMISYMKEKVKIIADGILL
jgi:heme/copper-type cytochrome/quinol oxidase subunit 4